MTDTLEKPLAGAATAGDVERALLARFPRGQAEEWDRCGLLVGDPTVPVTKVAVGLDASSANVRFAAEQGCNVLLTHHPAFLDPPSVFGPQARDVADAGTAVWEACRSGVALINFHTCLDRALVAQQQLPQLLGLDYEHSLEGWAALRASRGSQAVPNPGTPAYGAVCRAPGGMTVRELAERCGSVRAVNIVLLGVLSQLLPWPAEAYEEAVAACVKPATLAVNLAAFRAGRAAYQNIAKNEKA